jgi:hypothetical protein
MAQAERERESRMVPSEKEAALGLGCNKACPVHLSPLPPTRQVNGLTKHDILQGKSLFNLQNHVKSLTDSSVYVCVPTSKKALTMTPKQKYCHRRLLPCFFPSLVRIL